MYKEMYKEMYNRRYDIHWYDACMAMAVLLILASFLLSGCAILQGAIGQPQLQTYNFNYDGHEYSALLPEEVPLPTERAEVEPMCYNWIGPLCVMHVRYKEGHMYPVVSFWFTTKLGVVALVYHARLLGEAQHTPYLYLKGLPIKVTKDAINKALGKFSMGLEG